MDMETTSLAYKLKEKGIERFKDIDGKRKLRYKEKEIFEPLASSCKYVVKRVFNINI